MIVALAGVVSIALADSAQAEEEESGDGWTYEWDCDEFFFTNKREVNDGGSDWAANEHEKWPGDCNVHRGTW